MAPAAAAAAGTARPPAGQGQLLLPASLVRLTDDPRPHPLHTQDEFRRVMESYLSEMTRISFKLLEAFSLGLGLPANTLHPTFEVRTCQPLLWQHSTVGSQPSARAGAEWLDAL